MWTSAASEALRTTLSPGDRADPGLASLRALTGLAPIKDAKGSSMSIKLTDTHLVLLSAAAQREDRCLVAPPTLKGGAAQRVANKLISYGVVKEIRAKTEEPVWRRDEGLGASYALRLTAAGVKAIVADEGAEPENANSQGDALENRDQLVVSPETAARDTPIEEAMGHVPARPSAPRSGSKLAQVIKLLQPRHGATINELIDATDWLAHTTRAALTSLRKRGYAIAIDRSERGSFYRIQADLSVADRLPVARSVKERANSAARKPPQRSRSRAR